MNADKANQKQNRRDFGAMPTRNILLKHLRQSVFICG